MIRLGLGAISFILKTHLCMSAVAVPVKERWQFSRYYLTWFEILTILVEYDAVVTFFSLVVSSHIWPLMNQLGGVKHIFHIFCSDWTVFCEQISAFVTQLSMNFAKGDSLKVEPWLAFPCGVAGKQNQILLIEKQLFYFGCIEFRSLNISIRYLWRRMSMWMWHEDFP